MTMLKPSSLIGAGPVINLGTTNSVTVGVNVAIVATSGQAISGQGSDHEVIVLGTVASAVSGISLGNSADLSGNSVTVGSTGRVIALGANAVAIGCDGFDASVTNHGYVESGKYGIGLWGNSDTTDSVIINTGTIKAGQYGIIRDGNLATETIVLKNSGLIDSGDIAYGYFNINAPGRDLITNTGRMIGDVRLDVGNDKYDGRKGSLEGEVHAGSGNDVVQGGKEDNVFFGDDDGDRLTGGIGADQLSGGGGADRFIFVSAHDSTTKPAGRDTILDFLKADNDRFDLSAIDADSTRNGNQQFDFIGAHAFGGEAGELRFVKTADDTLIQADIDGDRKADFSVFLDTAVALQAGDFLL